MYIRHDSETADIWDFWNSADWGAKSIQLGLVELIHEGTQLVVTSSFFKKKEKIVAENWRCYLFSFSFSPSVILFQPSTISSPPPALHPSSDAAPSCWQTLHGMNETN